MKKIQTSITIALLSIATFGQVPRKIIVEHFTNTSCSICASRNPGFYSNLNSQSPKVLHLAVHPSAPYSNCLLYQQNTTANDARTNYYGVYGATPQLIINGNIVAGSANYSSSAIFAPYQSQFSPALISIAQQKFGSDSIKSIIKVKTVASHTLGSLSLFVALAEDTVFYSGNNGETLHFDVFRKSLSNTTGITFTLPSTIGDSVMYSFTSLPNAVWNFSRIYTIAILQETSNKKVVQAEAASASDGIVSGIKELSPLFETTIYPNPFSSEASIDFGRDQMHLNLKMTDVMGKVVLSLSDIIDRKITINKGTIKAGIYFLNISDQNNNNNNNSFNQKIIIQ
jgi:Secretion system C-terminal sorting domain